MSSNTAGPDHGELSIRIFHDRRRGESLVLRRSGERVWLDGDEYEMLRIVEPAGMEGDPLFHKVGGPFEGILSIAFQALSERRGR